MNTLLSDPSEYLLPAGVELLYETPEMPASVGKTACTACFENGSMDADNTGTTESIDPDFMDPFTDLNDLVSSN
jgi:hypothetical protein